MRWRTVLIFLCLLILCRVTSASAQIDFIYGQLAHPCTNLKSFVTGAINECIDPTTNAQYYYNGHWIQLQAGPMGPTGPSGPPGPNANLSAYVGNVSITGNQTTGADQISKLCVNGICPVTAFGAVNDGGVTDSSLAVQTALTTACTTNGGVYIPSSPASGGKYFRVLYPMIDTCAHTVPIYGDSSATSVLSGFFSNYPILVHYPSTYTGEMGTITGASLVAGSSNSLNFATNNATPPFTVNVLESRESFPNSVPLNGATGFTLDVWVNWQPNGTHNNNNEYTIWSIAGSDGADPTAGSGITQEVAVVGDGSTAGNLRFILNIAGTSNSMTANTAVTKNASHHIRAVLDPNGGTPKMCLYVDGTQVGSVRTVTGGTTIQELSDTTMLLGTDPIGTQPWPDSVPTADGPWFGTMFPIRIASSAVNACTAATITVPTAPLGSVTGTIFINNGNAGDFGTPALPSAPVLKNDVGGYTVLRGGSIQGAAMSVHDLSVVGGSQGILDILSPTSYFNNLTLNNNFGIGLELFNNSYTSYIGNVSCNNGGNGICIVTHAATFASMYNVGDTAEGIYGIVGTDGGFIYGGLLSPTGPTIASIVAGQASEFSKWVISGMGIDHENGGSGIPLKMVGQPAGNFEIDSFDAQGGSQPAAYFNNGNAAGGASATFNNLQVEGTPSELIHFLGTSTNPITLINPNVNSLPWSANTVPATTTESLKLISIYSDQGPVTVQRGYNFLYAGSGANKIPAAATSNAHQRACVSDGLTACTANNTYAAADGAQSCEVYSTGSVWAYSGSRC